MTDFSLVEGKPMIVWSLEELGRYFAESGNVTEEERLRRQLRIGGEDAFDFIQLKLDYLRPFLEGSSLPKQLAALVRLNLFFLYYQYRLGGRVAPDSVESQDLALKLIKLYRDGRYDCVQDISVVLVNGQGDFSQYIRTSDIRDKVTFRDQVKQSHCVYKDVLPEDFDRLIRLVYQLPG